MDLQIKESKWLIKCFLNYLRHDKNEVNVLFDILTIFLFHSRIDYTFLKEFYIIEVLITGSEFSVEIKLHSCISSFTYELSWCLLGCRRLSFEHEKGPPVTFSQPFPIKTTWSRPLGDCNANAHSSDACTCLSKWPKLGSG